MDAHHIFALDLTRRMHQCVGQFTVCRQQQQTCRVDVQTTNRDPARSLQARQVLEHGGATFGVVACGEFAFGLVVHQHACRFTLGGRNKTAIVEINPITTAEQCANDSHIAIDTHFALLDAFFERPAGAHASLRQHFVQALFELGYGVAATAIERKDAAGCISHTFCSGIAPESSSPIGEI